MNIDTLPKTIGQLERALDSVRTDLAAVGDSDPELRTDEICLEVVLTRYQKRLKNAQELYRRNAGQDQA